ncbi:MAG: hypothetical protein NTX73_00460 [Rhodobacterales bacterium]|nr:hypothetical protein [Rhodobacterales bacterium]
MRTFRLDRFGLVFGPNGAPVEIRLGYILANTPIKEIDLLEKENDRDIALRMRKAMLAPLLILTLMARASGALSPKAIDAIMSYTRRENRFVVQEGWVPVGDKRGVWPFLREMIIILAPDRADLDAYLANIYDEWGTKPRFDALTEALAKVAHADGTATFEQDAMGAAINRIADQREA